MTGDSKARKIVFFRKNIKVDTLSEHMFGNFHKTSI